MRRMNTSRHPLPPLAPELAAPAPSPCEPRADAPARDGAPPACLARGQVVRLRLARPMRLELHAGRVWLTWPGDLDDHFIAAGESLALGPVADLVVEGDGEGTAQLTWVPAAGARARRPGPGLGHTLAGGWRQAVSGLFARAAGATWESGDERLRRVGP